MVHVPEKLHAAPSGVSVVDDGHPPASAQSPDIVQTSDPFVQVHDCVHAPAVPQPDPSSVHG